MNPNILAAALLAPLLLAGCEGSDDHERSPGAAARYLDNVSANEAPADRAAAANGADEVSPAAGRPSLESGEAPIFSREPVAPRRP